jgi:DNA (cytosine-5)-methyltransferase 1
MLRVIRETKPRWIIGENVAGIIEMALGQVCAELEGLGYEVQCFVIPACAVNAPHRRDRVWIVAHSKGEHGEWAEPDRDRCRQSEMPTGNGDCPSPNTAIIGQSGQRKSKQSCNSAKSGDGETTESLNGGELRFPDWSRDWREVAFESCVRGVDDGLSRRVAVLPDGERISESRWRQNALKAYGNAIVPQVAMEIMRAIQEVDEQPIELKE